MKNVKQILRAVAVTALMTASTGLVSAQWSLTGNAGTTPGTNFLGTTDAKDVKIKANNSERIHIGSDGTIGFNGATTTISNLKVGINATSLTPSGGMYINSNPITLWGNVYQASPTYGYAINNVLKGYHSLENGDWKLYLNGAERFTVLDNGNVGIGVSNPYEKLEVDGGAYFTGGVYSLGNYNGRFATFTDGLTTTGNVTHNGSGSNLFTSNIEGKFANGLDVDDFLFADKIVGNTNSSNPGVTGNAIYNNSSLVSYGVFGSYHSSPFAFGVVCQGNGYYTGLWYQWSDRKLKKDIAVLENATDRIMKLQPKTYSYDLEKYDGYGLPEGKQMGFIAQEVSEVFPELTKTTTHHQDPTNPDAKQLEVTMVNYIGLIPVLTKAIQEQETKIEAQQQQLNEQAIRLERLEKLLGVAMENEDKAAAPSTGKLNKLFAPVPNPTTGETELAFEVDGNASNVMIVVRDMSGKSVTSFPISARGKSSITLQLNSLSSGVYSCELVVDGKVTDSGRVVKSN